ncbi:MAG TPA: HEAT repeat domain-containing protein [Umezawaea sp.]|nr:HEAT repeat domain-containing protein [Umezawaea sp.]
MVRSAAFEEFLAGVNAAVGVSRDSLDEIPDIGALYELVGEERVAAEDVLIAKLGTNDGRVAAALADADCVRAVPALVEATSERAAPTMRVFAARALLRLGDHSGLAAMVRLLRGHEGSGVDRGAAARLLVEFPEPDRELLLEVASTDPDGTARSEAFGALMTVVGLDDEEVLWGEVLLSVSGRLLSSLSTVRAAALGELREILAGWDAGESVEDLGLTWRADRGGEPLRRFVESLDSGKAEFAVDGLEALAGRERTLVENLVLLRLHADRRAVRAAGELGVRRAVGPLRELRRSAEGHARAEIESVLEGLA